MTQQYWPPQADCGVFLACSSIAEWILEYLFQNGRLNELSPTHCSLLLKAFPISYPCLWEDHAMDNAQHRLEQACRKWLHSESPVTHFKWGMRPFNIDFGHELLKEEAKEKKAKVVSYLKMGIIYLLIEKHAVINSMFCMDICKNGCWRNLVTVWQASLAVFTHLSAFIWCFS